MTRYALYWAPACDSALWQAGAAWLGRDPAGGVVGDRPDVPPDVTADPALYGFHATLQPPMRLRDGASVEALLASVAEAAACVPAFDLPRLAVAELDGFLCLRETSESAALQAFCDAMVAGADRLRAPAEAAELARRRAAGLDAAQDANLRRWGYPYVFGCWFFHMTLTRRLAADEARTMRPVAEAWFAAALRPPIRVRDVCVFAQSVERAPFTLLNRVALGV